MRELSDLGEQGNKGTLQSRVALPCVNLICGNGIVGDRVSKSGNNAF